jgi:hypothetical protein
MAIDVFYLTKEGAKLDSHTETDLEVTLMKQLQEASVPPPAPSTGSRRSAAKGPV